MITANAFKIVSIFQINVILRTCLVCWTLTKVWAKDDLNHSYEKGNTIVFETLIFEIILCISSFKLIFFELK